MGDSGSNASVVAGNEHRSILLRFPSEIWSLISSKLAGSTLGRLRECGSVALWTRLCSPGFVEMLMMEPGFGKVVPYPEFARSLVYLRHLDVSMYSNQDHDFVDFRVPLLPRTLETLAVRTNSKAEDFFLSPDATYYCLRDYTPRLQLLKCWMTADASTKDWIAGMPDTLQNLQLESWNPFCALPSSLTQLITSTIKDDCSSRTSQENVFCIPPNLTSLHVRMGIEVSVVDFLHSFMPTATLVNLNLGYREITLSKDHIAIFPPTLTSLKVAIEDDPFLNDSLFWSSLPLTHLDVGHINSCNWKDLPRTLTELRISETRQDEYDQLSTHISQLPSGLRIFRINSPPQWRLMGPSIKFPAHLQALHMPYSQMDSDCIVALPRTLKKLSVRYLDEKMCEGLPPKLEQLSLMFFVISPRAVASLPRTITHLKIPMAGDLSSIYDDDGEAQHVDIKEPLMESSELLYWTGDVVLPPNLTHLDMPTYNQLGDRFVMSLSPRLRYLDLMNTILVTDISIPHLSRNLVILDLNQCTALTSACFKDLPRKITFLRLAEAEQIYDQDIKHLPPRLDYLNLTKAIHLTNACVPDLPRGIVNLKMDENRLITSESLSHFPPPMLRVGSYKSFTNKNFTITEAKAAAVH